jgi:hypothetical protein
VFTKPIFESWEKLGPAQSKAQPTIARPGFLNERRADFNLRLKTRLQGFKTLIFA